VTVFLHDRPSAAWVARELAAGHAIDIRCDSAHDFTAVLAAEKRPGVT
jgi:hypothetical protein